MKQPTVNLTKAPWPFEAEPLGFEKNVLRYGEHNARRQTETTFRAPSGQYPYVTYWDVGALSPHQAFIVSGVAASYYADAGNTMRRRGLPEAEKECQRKAHIWLRHHHIAIGRFIKSQQRNEPE